MTVVGIDLGTTNTVVGVTREGQAAALADEHGERLIPSVVSFHPNGSVMVGRPAKERRLVDAPNTIYSVKRLIGRSWDSEEVRRARERFPFEMREGPGQAALVVARGQSYTLPEISAFVLRRAKAVAEAALGEAIDRAVITVPANFNDLQRAATKVAGRVAGLEVLRILNEPTAAALAYGYGKSANERIAVYDFGGGTFDVTLLDLSENVFEVLATAGNTFLGGDDIDLAIAERMALEFLARHKYDPRTDGQAFERLRAAAEDIKIRLSRESEASIHVAEVAHGPGGKPLDLDFRMTSTELEQVVAPLLASTFDVCREALGIARLSATDFDQVLLVGGSTRIPLVRQRVEEFFRRPVLGHISPDEVVAIGAAIQAAALTGADRRRDIPQPPAPSSRQTAPPMARKGNTWPGAASAAGVPSSFDPSTQPYGQRGRKTTSPGVQADSNARQLPAGAGQPLVVTPPGTEPPGTVSGLGPRGRVPTGTGLGPDAQRARAQTGTLASADAAAQQARAMTQPGIGSAFGPKPSQPGAPPRAAGLEDPTHEAQHIASFLARYSSTPQKARPTGPQAAAPPPAPKRDESVPAFRLTEDDIQYEDPSAIETQQPSTEQLRKMAAPASTDEVTEVHRRRITSSRSSIDESALPIPEDPTMDTATSPAGRVPFGGTAPMAAAPSPMAGRPFPPVPFGGPGSVTQPGAGAVPMTQPLPQSIPGAVGPFGVQSTLVSGAASPVAAAPTAGPPLVYPSGTLPGMSPSPAAVPGAWGPAAGVVAGGVGYAQQPPAVHQMPSAAPPAPLLVDVTPLTLAVETVHGYCDPVIDRNTPVPCERSRTFVTAADNQTTVRVRVGQGESKAFRENTYIGEVELTGLRPSPKGQTKIEVAFALDTDGILNVRAIDVLTGHEAKVTVRLVAVPEMDQIAAMRARTASMPFMT